MDYTKTLRSTKSWKEYWEKNTLVDYWKIPVGLDFSQGLPKEKNKHPHRQVIIKILKKFQFRSILEVGCGGGANLYAIKQEYPHADIGGIDWSAALITEAQKILPKASILQVGEATDVYISNKGSDMILSDMCFIYLNGKEFKKAIKEADRKSVV